MVMLLTISSSRLQKSARTNDGLERRPLFLSLRGMARTLLLGIFFVSAPASLNARVEECVEATRLWIPSDVGHDRSVIKWNKAIKYGIVAKDNDEETRRSVEEALNVFSLGSGLSVQPEADLNAILDLSILLPPNIASFAPGARTFVERYFQDIMTKRGAVGTIEIDAAKWSSRYKNVEPKCAGVQVVLNDVVERAFVMIEKGESEQCAEIALGELSGLVNIRAYYMDHGRNLPADLVRRAFRTLYDARVKTGSSRQDALKQIEEVCQS